MIRNRVVPLHRIPSLLMATTLAGSALAGVPDDFTVSLGKKSFRLSEHRGHYVALHFLLPTECPYCLSLVREYGAKAPTVAGVRHVFLKPDAEADILAWTAKVPPGSPAAEIYRDADGALAMAFEIRDGYAFHGQTTRYPALVLLGPDGKEVFRHVGKNNTDRLPFKTFAAKVAEWSANPALSQYNLEKGKPAVDGYDVVAYFESSKAQKGTTEFTSEYRGVVYQFASAARREQFATHPESFVPAYGGWCATAMAEGKKVEIDPANFKVTKGRLFLFYKGWLGDALKDWNKKEAELTRNADQQWSKLAPQDLVQVKGKP